MTNMEWGCDRDDLVWLLFPRLRQNKRTFQRLLKNLHVFIIRDDNGMDSR